MLGELILRITAQVDGVISGLNRTKAAFDNTSNAINKTAGDITKRYTKMLENTKGKIEDLRKEMGGKGRGFFDAAAVKADEARLKTLQNRLVNIKGAIKGVTEAAKVMQREQTAAMRLAEATARTTLQNTINVGSMMRQAGAGMRTAGMIIAVATAAMVAAGVDLAKTGLEFQQTLDIVVSVVGEFQQAGGRATDTFVELTAVIRKLGETTNFTASQVAQAARALGQAGLKGAEIVSALPGTVNLARAGLIDLSRAAEIAADFMNAFGLEGREIARVADSMAAAAANSNTTIEQLGNAFGFAAPIAAALGQSVEGTSAALAVLANSGIKSSRAGTGLAQILSALIRKTSDTTALMEKYGSSFDAVNPQIRSTTEIIEEFKRVGVSAADVMKFFGERAGRAMIALQNAPTDKIRELTDVIENSFGEALRQATERWTNLAGSVKAFISVVESIKLTVFEAVQQDLINTLNMITDKLRTVSEALRDGPFAKLVRPVALLAAGFTVLAGTLGTVAIAVGTLLSVWGGAAASMASMAIATMSANAALDIAAKEATEAAIAAFKVAGANTAAAASYAQLATAAKAAQGAQAQGALTAAIPGLGAVSSAAAEGTLMKLLVTQAGKAMIAIKGLTATLGMLLIPVVALAALGAAMVAAFEFDDDTFQRYESIRGAIAAISDTIQGGFLQAIQLTKDAFAAMGEQISGVTGWLSKFGEEWLGLDPDVSAWDNLVASMRHLASVVSLLADQFGPGLGMILGLLATIVGGTLKLAFDGLLVALTLAVQLTSIFGELVAQSAGWLMDWADALWGTADGVSSLEKSYDRLNAKLKDNSEQVEKQLKTLADRAKANDKDAKQIGEMASLLAKKDELDVNQLKHLRELQEEYGDYEAHVQRLTAEYENEIELLEKLIAENRGSERAIALANAQLTVARHKLEEVEKSQQSLIETEAKYGAGIVANTAATEANTKAKQDAIDAQLEYERVLKEGEESQKALTKILKDGTTSRLNAYDREIAKLKELQAATVANANAAIAKNNALIRSAQEQIQAAEDAIAADAKEGQTLEAKKAADARRRAEIKEHTARQARLKAESEQLRKDTLKERALQQQDEDRVTKKQAQKQSDFRRDQKLAQLKLSKDKIKIAEAEADKFLDMEKRRIEATFIMNDAATRRQKAAAISAAKDLAQAQVEAARREVAEDEKKAREAEAKKRAASLKKAKKEELSLEEAIIKEGAKKVQNMQQLIQLTMFLHQLQRAREVRAANAVKAVFKAREKIARLEKVNAERPGNENIERGLSKAKEKLRFEEAFAGKKLNEAGVNVDTRQGFKDLSTGIAAALESSETTLGVISTTLIDSLQVQRAILAAILGKSIQAAQTGQNAAQGVQALAPNGGIFSVPPPQLPPPTPTPTPPPTASKKPHTNFEKQHEIERKEHEAQVAASRKYRKEFWEKKHAKEKAELAEVKRVADAHRAQVAANKGSAASTVPTQPSAPVDVSNIFGDGPPGAASGEMFGSPDVEFPSENQMTGTADINVPIMTGDPNATSAEDAGKAAKRAAASKALFKRRSEEARAQANLSRKKRLADAPHMALPSDKLGSMFGDRPETVTEAPIATAPSLDTRQGEMFGRRPSDEINSQVPTQAPMKWKEGTPFFTPSDDERAAAPDIAKAILDGFALLKSANPRVGVANLTPPASRVQALAPSGAGSSSQTLTDNRKFELVVNNNMDEARVEQIVKQAINTTAFDAIG